VENLLKDNYFANESSTFGDRIIAARESVGLNQSDFARKLGVQLKTVKKWEEDLSEPRANKLQMIAGLLNVSITWLIMGQGAGLKGPSDELEHSADMNEILIELRQTKSELSRLTEHLGALEKKLRRIGK
jgi:transcriptional regulator with XRE-family HTH domain|tara:strand:+ start:226 stop:615 length:390 start_codon:yes stop_codon:yes gene_type:complete